MFSRSIIFLFLIHLCYHELAFSQLEADNWMYSADQYVNFNKATFPQPHRYPSATCVPQRVGVTSYSDRQGNLIFYSDGNMVYDRNFLPVPSVNSSIGGAPLLGCGYSSTFPSQGVLGIPWPNNPNLYILFHIYSATLNNFKSPLYYSVFDKRLNNGLGDIVNSQKNIQLLSGIDVSYKLTAVLHCNKKDVWVIGHLSNSNKYFSILVTSAGVSSSVNYFSGTYIPVVNSLGLIKENDVGCIKVSASGNKLAAAHKGLDFVELFDFDNSNGSGYNLSVLKTSPNALDTTNSLGNRYMGPFGVEFSPSGKLLYVSSSYHLRSTANNGIGAFLYQYNTFLGNQQAIQNSQYQVCMLDSSSYAGALQIANNGKLYFNASQDLYAIENPENIGIACGFSGMEINMVNQFPNLNLPGYLQSYFSNSIAIINDCGSRLAFFKLKDTVGVNSVRWNFGDIASGPNNNSNYFNPSHIFSQSGIFKVSAIIYSVNSCNPDTVNTVIGAGAFDLGLGRDTFFCKGDSLILRLDSTFSNVVWEDGTIGSTHIVIDSGLYFADSKIGNCLVHDSIFVSIKPQPKFSLGNDTVVCGSQKVTLRSDHVINGAQYLWSDNSVLDSFIVIGGQAYWLRITDQYGCWWSDTINVIAKSLPGFSLGVDTSICAGKSLSLNAFVSGNAIYEWSNGSVDPRLTISAQGLYWCEVTQNNCKYRDSIQVGINPLPMVYLGKDTSICAGTILVLDAEQTTASYRWQDNSSQSTFSVNAAGDYWVEVNKNGCLGKDTISIALINAPQFSLGENQLICAGNSKLLKPVIDAGWTLQWQDGSVSSAYLVSNPGLYSLTATNKCGFFKDEVLFTQGLCDLYVPSAFTPNNDSRNDLFRVAGTDLITQYHIQIFNRYGQVVYESADKLGAWDGKYKGIEQPSGSYVWLIEYKSLNNRKVTIKGSLLLLH